MKDAHIPVLLESAIKFFNFDTGLLFIDCTLGNGGHTRELLKKMSPDSVLIAIDRDPGCIESARTVFSKEISDGRLITVQDSFSNIMNILEQTGHSKADGILADLGVSSMQLDTPERGFSFQVDAPLDMRMSSQIQLTARDVVNSYTREKLEYILKTYGDESACRRIAREIITEREKTGIETTFDLNRIIKRVKKEKPGKKKLHQIHPSTKTFMALRIEVNREFEELESLLESIPLCLNPDGVISIISFHSGEDRIVKDYFRQESSDCICDKKIPQCTCNHTASLKTLTPKPLIPEQDESDKNPRARSAKLRSAKKT